MGGQSSSKLNVLEKCGTLLTSAEKKLINETFDDIAGSKEADRFTENHLKLFLEKYELTGINCRQLMTSLSRNDKAPSTPGHVTYGNFVTNISTLIKGSPDQRSQLLVHLLPSPLTSDKVQSLLIQFLTLLFSNSNLNSTHFPQLQDWPSNEISLRGVVSHMTQSLGANNLDKIEIRIWLMATPLANVIIKFFFIQCFLLPHSTVHEVISEEEMLIPVKVVHPLLNVTFKSTLLDHASLLYIHQWLPYETRGVAYPLFSSKVHGQSFSTFCRQILDRGPTLIIIRDTNGHVFGGVATNPWRFTPQFIGDSGCFLFTLSPSIGVYMPTGYNDHYMYLQQSAQTLPNGLGMGGQINYFGLWLSSDFGHGSSKGRPKCSTFGSPCLSSDEEFTIDIVEVWGIGRPLLPDDMEEQEKTVSILDVDKEARALLEIAGKPRLSEGLRDEPDDDD